MGTIYFSEKYGLPTKAQLQDERLCRWRGLLAQNNIALDLAPWWTDEEKAFETSLWEQVDIVYESQKEALRVSLSKLDQESREEYFNDISKDRYTDYNEYLPESPVSLQPMDRI